MSVAGASEPSASAAQPSAAPFSFTADTVHSFPPAFLAFLRDNDIHVDNYRITDVPRYLRVSPRASLTQAELERQLGTSCEPVAWLPGYFRLRGDVKIATSDAYRAGHIYGIDVSSGAAVAALDPQPGEHVLDLCCAPGAKLCAIADAMGLRGSVTGVDVSAERLAACRTLCQKCGAPPPRPPPPPPLAPPPPAPPSAQPRPPPPGTASPTLGSSWATGEASASRRRAAHPRVSTADLRLLAKCQVSHAPTGRCLGFWFLSFLFAVPGTRTPLHGGGALHASAA